MHIEPEHPPIADQHVAKAKSIRVKVDLKGKWGYKEGNNGHFASD